MTQTVIQKSFAPFKKYLPPQIYNPIRTMGTVIIGPFLFGYKTGYFKSAFRRKAVAKDGAPLPWYTYPAIYFLKYRNFSGTTILEFGGGQSTLWWAQRAKKVVTMEGDREWFEKLKKVIPNNVDLYYISTDSKETAISQVNQILEIREDPKYDVIIIDGLFRYELIQVALNKVTEDGMIICDNAEGYGFYDGFKESGLQRVDFFGMCPGVVLPHCTSIFFRSSSFAFGSGHPIPVMAKEW